MKTKVAWLTGIATLSNLNIFEIKRKIINDSFVIFQVLVQVKLQFRHLACKTINFKIKYSGNII